MAVKQIKSKRNRAGTVWNTGENLFVGYRIDVWIHGKRYRNNIFPTRREAERFIENLKLEEKIEKRGLSDDELVDLFVGIREKTVKFAEFKERINAYQFK